MRDPLPEERTVGTDDAERQVEAILEESEARIAHRVPEEKRRSEDTVDLVSE